MALAWNFEESLESTTSQSQSINIGTAASDRIVLVHISCENSGEPSTMTIGGISATRHTESTHSSLQFSQWWSAEVPTGTTATLNCDIDVGNCHIATYSLTGADPTPTDTSNGYGLLTAQHIPATISDLTIPTGGVGFYGACYDNTGSAVDWTTGTDSATVDSSVVHDDDGGSNSMSTAHRETAGTPSVDVTWTSGPSDDVVITAVAFGPASSASAGTLLLHGIQDL